MKKMPYNRLYFLLKNEVSPKDFIGFLIPFFDVRNIFPQIQPFLKIS